ncbi:HAD-IA family hydrolase [Tessaracoccus rhinocerotis]|uniref:HAD-IA family hydrolase n=1 Tax=Tessaracoccus rhinocerotis TaxID=1689449 RepID=A0A553JYY6_9ACTN|nr:HAD-IA family hydrolase [Tessaracoccus rhinocerotis]TRY17654.1 HAD-IA family hydrolase [Tessaracoccus rhinocerotis]
MPNIIFDCDGVLADTELHGHLPAFNQTFAEFGLPLEWSREEYGVKLQIGGGKERMASDLTPEFCAAHGHPGEEARAELIAQLHKRKSALFQERARAGELPPRPGIRRVITAALAEGWTVAVASTSAEASVRAVLEHAVGEEQAARCHVFAGDIVAHKKPAPDIYLLVLDDLALDPAECVVVEDSAIGCRAAVAAGLTTVVTTSAFTADEDFTGAARVLAHLGDPDEPIPPTPEAGDFGGRYVELADLRRLIADQKE